MKKSIITAILFLFIAYPLKAQNCSRFYPMNEGTTFQYTSLNKKGKTEGVADYQITRVFNDGPSTSATMQISYKDDKGEELFNTDYTFTCTGNVVSIDYES
ncbi:MAG: hypothetical protein KJO73_11770, partial [Croceitalea sp.]|nr:hypothetical protein [Croceitalea sp.]